MRILLTGAAGFFGSRAAMYLADHELVATDHPQAVRNRLTALAPNVSYEACDLGDPNAVAALVARARPEVAIHLAWYAVPGKYLDAAENIDHLGSTLHLVRTLAGAGCKRIVTAGTCFEYDTDVGVLGESSPTRPHHLYSASKLAVFEVVAQACRLWNVSYAHPRFFYQYGPWEAPGRLVPAIVAPLLRGEEALVSAGEQVRDFLHIDDVGRAIAAIATASLEGAINVGSGEGVRVRDVVEAAARACGREELVRYGAIAQRPGDPAKVVADTTKLRSIGWAPAWSLDRGMQDTVAWYQEAR